MLAPADAAIARRDLAIPGLATVLDPDALCRRLRAALPRSGIEALRPTYVRYKPGTSCLVGYQVRAAGTEISGYAKALSHGGEPKLVKAERKARVSGPGWPGALLLSEPVVGFAFYPNDPDLPAMGQVALPRRRRALLRRMVPERPELWEGELTPLAYKPERRFVGRLDTASGPAAVLKVYRGDADGFEAARVRSKTFCSRGTLQIASRIGTSARHHVVAFDWVPGRPLDQAIADGSAGAVDLAVVGAALAELHRQEGEGLPAPAPARGAAQLAAAAAAVGAVAEDLADDAERLAQRIARWMVRAPRGRLPLHGDFSADQVLLTPDGAALLDLDEAVLGDPASDLGMFAADLCRATIAGEVAPEVADGLVAELRRGYAAALAPHLVPPRPASVACYTAAWLVRLATEPFRRRQPDWHRQTAEILAAARERLDAR